MSRNVFALLVGIDAYRKPVPALSGCVNDIEAFAAYLGDRVDGRDGTTLHLRSLKDDGATRDAIIAGFRGHLARAKAGDVALFYYAGHGSQEPAPPEFWHLEPDKLDETLVCHDSREKGRFDLADKELAKLIDEVAAGGAHTVIILDCCHSGSGTRALDDGTMAVRRAPLDDRIRPLDSFLVGVGEAERLSGKRGMDVGSTASLPGRHVLLAACRDEQVASEYRGDGRPRGAFSYFLGDTLRMASGPLTYRDLFARIQPMLRKAIPGQSPQIEATRPEDFDALFLDGAIRPSEPYYLVSAGADGWALNAGAVHGLPRGEGPEAVTLALFPFDAPAEMLRDRSKALGSARLAELGTTSSRVTLEGVGDPAPDATFKAVISRWPLPALAVGLGGDDEEGIDLGRAALGRAGPDESPSLFLREAREGETPEYRLLASRGQYVIAGPVAHRPLVGQIDGYSAANARKAVERLEHMARWNLAARMSNPASTIRPDEVTMTILQGDVELKGPEIRLEYRLEGGKWVQPEVKVRLENKGNRRLYAAILNLTETFKISAALQESGSIRLGPGETAWALQARPIPVTVPDELWKQGVVEYKDILKLLVCTDEFDARLMAQPALDLPRPEPKGPRELRGLGEGSLDRLMRRVQTRDFGDDESVPLDDWTASAVTFTTVRPQEDAPVPKDGGPMLTLTGGVKLQGHSRLAARARLTTTPLASRDLGNLALPRLLQEDQSVSEPFSLAPTRSTAPGLSVLDLTGVVDHTVVTPEEPLRLESPTPLAEGEHVLPVGFDGEFFLPLGRSVALPGGGTEIILDRLPDPTLPDGRTRSLGGSIRIFFQKVTSRVLGREFEYPLLAAADVNEQEVVAYEKDEAKVAARVAKADRILLMIHGIIGDTLELRRGARRAKVGPDRAPLDSKYDLVLTFDYENLNTPIEDVARSLKARLDAVGLGADHGKALDIAAHSMGGLVSRWFIEREGGNRVVRRLVMLGTPNGGSPWPGVHDWAIATLSLGLNSLAGVAWPAAAAGWLVGKLEDLDVNLDQMQPSSAFLKELADGEDPGIPYVMVAGNTSLVPAAVEVDASGTSPLERLMGKLFRKPLLHAVAGRFFHGLDNDIAASIPSMEDVPGPRDPAYDVRPVACDHISYFSNPAGLKALAGVLLED